MNEEPNIATTQPPNFPSHAVAENCPLLITPSGPLLQENCWGGGVVKHGFTPSGNCCSPDETGWHSGPGI